MHFLKMLILGSFYYFIFTPIGFFLRVIKGDLLNLKLDPDVNSYWSDRNFLFSRKFFKSQRISKLFSRF